MFVVLIFIYTKNQQVFENKFSQSCTKGVFPFIRPTSTFSIKTHFTISHRSLLYLFFFVYSFFPFISQKVAFYMYSFTCCKKRDFFEPWRPGFSTVCIDLTHVFSKEPIEWSPCPQHARFTAPFSLHWFNPCLFQRAYWVSPLPTTG